jgi:hypothetical protein
VATIAESLAVQKPRPDLLSGTPRAGFVDRWIYVFTAASFIVITLTGFIPDSLARMAAIEAGERPPFPFIVHVHAVLMGSFLLLLLAQTTLVATGKCDLHRRLGLAAMVIVPALVAAGFLLVPTNYHAVWNAAQSAPPGARERAVALLPRLDNIMLMQFRIGLLFPLLIFVGLRVRGKDAGLHKRMMILATAMALPAAIDRMTWLPTTLPANPIAPDLYTLLAVSPMFVWDVIRNRSVHRAYWIWLAICAPFTIAVHGLWDSSWWHATAPRLMGL